MKSFKDVTDKEKVIKVFLFLLTPFLSFFVSLKNISSRSSYIIFICFSLLFGLNFTVTDDTSGEYSLDGSYYRSLFERNYVSYGMSFSDMTDEYLSFSADTSTDLYADFVSYLVSSFTNNYHILFLVYALVFTYFMAKSLKYLLKSPNFKNGSIVCLLLFFLFIYNDIFNINGVRFWTAAWIAVYSLFRIFVDNKKRYYALICVTPLVHASFILFVLVSFLGVFLNKSASSLKHLLLVSIVLSPLMLIAIQSLDITGMPAFFGRYFDLYAADQAVSEYGERRTSTLYYIISTIFSVASLIYVNILTLKIKKEAESNSQFNPFSNFLVILIIFCNLSMILPSVGARYIILCYPIIAYLWLNLKGVRKESGWIMLFPLFFFMSIRGKLLLYTTVLESDFYYMNLLSLILKNV